MAGPGYGPHSLSTNNCHSVSIMTSTKQRTAARQNIKRAGAAAKRKRTVAHLPKSTRTALGRQGAKAARSKRRHR
jgi:nitrate/TMAO reductase-like tetraheme cytochrome c subunit